MAPLGQGPLPKPGCLSGSIPQCHSCGLQTGAAFPLAGHWTAWGGDGPSPPSPVQVPEGEVTHTRGTLDLSRWYLRAQHLPGAVVRELPVTCSSSSCYKYFRGLQLVGPHLCLASVPCGYQKQHLALPRWSCGASGSAGCPWRSCWGRGRAQPPLPVPELRMSVDMLPPCLSAFLLLLLLSQWVWAGTEGDPTDIPVGSSAKAQSWRGHPNLCNFLSNNAALTSSQCLSCPGDAQPSPHLSWSFCHQFVPVPGLSLSQPLLCFPPCSAVSRLCYLVPPCLSVLDDWLYF